jgi:tetratricopeptide (TPR) repeat protein
MVNRDGVLATVPPQLSALQEALQQAPDDAEVLGQMAELELDLGRIWSSLEHAQAAERLDPANPLRAALVGELLAGLRAFPEARAAFDRALVHAPDRVDYVVSTIATYQAEGDLNSAEDLLKSLPQPHPRDRMLLDVRYRQFLYQRRFAEALELVDRVFGKAAVAKTADAWVRLLFHIEIGTLRQLLGHAGTAQSEFQLALHLDGELRAAGADPRRLASVLGLTHAGLGNQSLALGATQDYLAAIEDDYRTEQAARLQLARIHARFGEADAAIALLSASLAAPFGTTASALRLDPAWAPLRGNLEFEALSAQDE